MKRLLASWSLSSALLFALALVGCDSAPESTETDAPKPGAPAGDFGIISDAKLAAICAGDKPPKGLPAYKKTAGKASPMKLYLRDGAEGKFAFKSSTVFTPWRPKADKETQLVACIDAKKKTKARECKFDKEKPAKWVDQYDVSYSISVREAATGKEVAKQDVEVKADAKCPTLFFFKNDREQDLAAFEPALLAIAAALQPADAPPPKIRAKELVIACDGKPVLGAKKYEKKAGNISKTRVFRREGEGGWVDGMHQGQTYRDHDWWSVEAEEIELIACVQTTRGAKAKECEFKGGSKIDLVDASYTITLYEALTGKKLEEKKFDAKSAARCPFIWNFKEGEENVFLADPGDAAKKWLATYAAP